LGLSDDNEEEAEEIGVVESDKDETDVGFTIKLDVDESELNVSSFVVEESDERQLFADESPDLLVFN
jgi:hypothetical protein